MTLRFAFAAAVLCAPAASWRSPSLGPTRRTTLSSMVVARSRTLVALYEDDPWLTSGEALPSSAGSLDVLFRYGPVVFVNRCLSPGEYNASVRNFMSGYPRISRALAEQEINEFIADATGYMARTTAKDYKGPKEEELKPPVGLVDKALVVAWVAVLVPAASILIQLCLDAPPVNNF